MAVCDRIYIRIMVKKSPTFQLPGTPDESAATIVPATSADSPGKDKAADVIRAKISRLYAEEPDADKELEEATEPGPHSKHQRFLLKLHQEKLSQEDIQVRWHEYYQDLSEPEKHEVWQEFYSNQNRHTQSLSHEPETSSTPHEPEKPIPLPSVKAKRGSLRKKARSFRPKATTPAVATQVKPKKAKKKQKTEHAAAPAKLGAKHHFKSILFGLGMGAIVLFLLMFTFFNERYITPFIQPNQIAAATPIITVPGAVVSSEPKVIIPKLNVEAPVVYDVPFIQPGEDEKDFEERTQAALENGVVHYPTSQKPGESGQGFNSNAVIVGHSSNNLFSRGKYKFAFMQLNQLNAGDTFMLNYNSKQYVYKVYEKKVVKPTEVSVLGAASRPNSATLITCDPPGFNINRLVIIAEQISPNPATNVLTDNRTETPENLVVPSNPKTMWERLWGWITGD